jgi:NTP pyrophosphatase (non-canonical NTP hydrolase)
MLNGQCIFVVGLKFKNEMTKRKMTFSELNERVLVWAHEKGILEKATKFKQAQKTLEECGELLHAIGAGDKDEIKDAIGDVLVTIIIQAEMNDLDIRDCLRSAYDVIKGRSGKMVNGQFLKD